MIPACAMTVFSDRLKSLILRRIAERAFTSQADVARAMGIGDGRFGHWATGRSEPDIESINRICEVLATHPNYLFGHSDEPTPRYVDNVSKLTEIEREIKQIRRLLGRPTGD